MNIPTHSFARRLDMCFFDYEKLPGIFGPGAEIEELRLSSIPHVSGFRFDSDMEADADVDVDVDMFGG